MLIHDNINQITNAMKKQLLFIVFLLSIVGVSTAQDVWYTGLHQNPDVTYYWGAAIYKNGEMQYLVEDNTGSYAPIDLVFNPNNGDYYFAYSFNDNDNYIVKNGSEVILHVSGDGTRINKIYWYDAPSGDPEDCLYAVGHVHTSSDIYFHAAVWRGSNPTPLYLWGESQKESTANDLVVVDLGDPEPTVIYAGDYQYHATIFTNDEIAATLSTDRSEVKQLIVTDDWYLFSLGYVIDPVTENSVIKVWKEDMEYYSLSDPDVYSGADAMAISAGDIYVFGSESSVRKIWKNEDVIYENGVDGYLMNQLAATSHLYYGFDGDIYKDFELLYDSDEGMGSMVCQIVVEEACDDPEVRNLPYTEEFAFMDTDWECWTIEDEGANNDVSFWYRNGSNSDYDFWFGDDDCAVHQYSGDDYQEGRLVSPAIALPANQSIKLEFYSYLGYLNDYYYSGVEISTVEDPTNFTEVWQLDPTSDPGNEWVLYDVDLTAFAGQTVHVAFTYRGENAHSWAVDDVNITSSPTGVNENSEGDLAVSPNPASDHVCITGLKAGSEVQIYNSLGMMVKSLYVAEDEKINVRDLASGLYMIRCGNQTIRLIKE